jgi:flagellar FliL protein
MADDEDFEGEGGDEAEFEGGGGGNSKKKLLLIVIPLVLVIGGGAVAYFTGLADPLIAMITGHKKEAAAEGEAAPAEGEEHAAEGGHDAKGKEGEAAKEGEHGKPAKDKKKEAKAGGEHGGGGGGGDGSAVFYDLPEMLVNINTAGRKRNFLKLRVSLELADEADINIVENVLPRIVDNFQVYLRELRLEDLQGAAGMYRLREELLTRVNAAVRPAQVKDVLFKEMIVQ